MATYFLWVQGLRGPCPIVLSERSGPALNAHETTWALSKPRELSDVEATFTLASLAVIYPAPVAPVIEETRVKL